MSKLAQKLKGVAESASPAMGFRPAAMATKPRGPLLVAVLARPDVKSAKAALDAGADVLLAKTADPRLLAEIAGAAGGSPLGIEALAADKVDMSALKEAGCDFVVFSTAAAPAGWLRLEDMARVPRVTPSVEATALRGLDRIAIDAVLLDNNADDEFVSVQFVMTAHFLTAAVGKPVMAMLPAAASAEDIAALWDAGVDAMVAEAAAARLRELRKSIASLPPRSRKKGGKETALLPRISVEPEPPPEEEEDGE